MSIGDGPWRAILQLKVVPVSSEAQDALLPEIGVHLHDKACGFAHNNEAAGRGELARKRGV
jgi:hypothetical protein